MASTIAPPKPESLDLSKERPDFFRAPRTPELVDLPEAAYLAMEGTGAPEQALSEAIPAMYTIAYGLKFRLKRAGRDFKVCPVEGQWWCTDASGDESPDLAQAPDSDWHWRLLLMVPDFVTAEDVEAVKAGARTTKPAVNGASLIRWREGLSVQALHIGPYDSEQPTVEAMRAMMVANHLEPAGRHHEVYLGDPRLAKPEKLRTLLRLPVRRAE